MQLIGAAFWPMITYNIPYNTNNTVAIPIRLSSSPPYRLYPNTYPPHTLHPYRSIISDIRIYFPECN